jgi:site-specific DNA-methyltransferase (adenine-specific)
MSGALDVLAGAANVALEQGDCKERLRLLPDNSVDSIVTDPPYELGFMGKGWDKSGIAFDVEMWAECLRVLKPGGHVIAFSGSRTYHRMACAIEDAGFEVRDQILWLYGSGMPKSLNVSKAIDKAAGAEREVVGVAGRSGSSRSCMAGDFTGGEYMETAPATDAARQWDGWGTALKPAHEPACLARKPFPGTVAANMIEWGTGGINIDACRVPVTDAVYAKNCSGDRGHGGTRGAGEKGATDIRTGGGSAAQGRWPANLCHDGSDEVVSLFPADAGAASPVRGDEPSGVTNGIYGDFAGRVPGQFHGDTGSAARFFYCSKASRKDRNDGLESSNTPVVSKGATMRDCETVDWSARNGNDHPTVKPTPLMEWLVKLVTCPGGVVLDPFMGSGSTGRGARLGGFRFIGFDLSGHYVDISGRRIAAAEATAAKEAAKPAKVQRKPKPKKTAPAPDTAAQRTPVQLTLLGAA